MAAARQMAEDSGRMAREQMCSDDGLAVERICVVAESFKVLYCIVLYWSERASRKRQPTWRDVELWCID